MAILELNLADTTAARLNKLRAGVLGANDGIVSVAATVIGVAAATQSVPVIATAGFAALAAGAFSMSAGEYISVSTQRDTEKVLIEDEEDHDEIRSRLTAQLQQDGAEPATAAAAARQMVTHSPKHALGMVEGVDPDDLVNPWQAAIASFVAFIIGAILPLATILLLPAAARIPGTFASVLVALALTGYVSARLGEANPRRAMVRTMIGGALAMAATYGIGNLFDVPV